MHLSPATAIAILSILSPFTFGQNLNEANNINLQVTRDDEFDLAVELDIKDVELGERDFLDVRKTQHCSNQGKIKRVKKEYKGKCDPKNSRGFLSAHNCDNKSGKSYLCVQNKKAKCYTVKDAEKHNFENGECFVGK